MPARSRALLQTCPEELAAVDWSVKRMKEKCLAETGRRACGDLGERLSAAGSFPEPTIPDPRLAA